MHSLEVYNPAGTIEITQLYAPRLVDLSGKTICELSNLTWEDERTFPLIRELLKKRFPNVKIIPYTEFQDIYGMEPDALSEVLREKGCDGAIVGNAA
ncbi:hypothetical protein ACFLXX_04150 [Chloroflexota bacterium]